ncbi:MAG: hypothetical protein H7646_02050, partial [Candidatus Heimdallarchaeota archaeon]|nr:hypothetical protein [Candidatus Heimdallarchaeota archaeon]
MKTLEDFIPEGDNVRTTFRSVSELVEILLGGTPSTSINEYWNGDIN